MKDPVVKIVTIVSVIAVVLTMLWASWYIGGNAPEAGFQWCTFSGVGQVICRQTLVKCENQEIRATRCVKTSTAQQFYCGKVQGNIACWPTREPCNLVSSEYCEAQTYQQAKLADPRSLFL